MYACPNCFSCDYLGHSCWSFPSHYEWTIGGETLVVVSRSIQAPVTVSFGLEDTQVMAPSLLKSRIHLACTLVGELINAIDNTEKIFNP
jgi:hypothetical protein